MVTAESEGRTITRNSSFFKKLKPAGREFMENVFDLFYSPLSEKANPIATEDKAASEGLEQHTDLETTMSTGLKVSKPGFH